MHGEKNIATSYDNTIDESRLPSFIIPDTHFVSLSGGSSRGYAKKAKVDGIWYKVSAGAFNAQAEVVASRLAKYTNISEYAEYDMCVVNGDYATMSKDFLAGLEDETVKSLHAIVTGAPIEPMLEKLTGNELFRYVREIVHRGIGLDISTPEVFRKLSLLLQFDALVLNEDRHFNNIKFVNNGGAWDLSIAFDFDCSLFSCIEDLSTCADYAQPSLPFYLTHPEQLEWLYSMSNDRLILQPFTVSELTDGVWEKRHQIGKREVEEYLAGVAERRTGI
jgi:hypothetical protein